MSVNPKLLNKIRSPFKKVLFLGYSQNETRLIDVLINAKCEVWHSQEKNPQFNGFDVIISFGYRHIICKEDIELCKAPIINLHISYLPWNRGAHPNFWSFYDNTPSGVTIHLVDEGIDTGPIIFQKYVEFNDDQSTFRSTQTRLINEVENLFIENISQLIACNFKVFQQNFYGTYHSILDLPSEFRGWDLIAKDEVSRLKIALENKAKKIL